MALEMEPVSSTKVSAARLKSADALPSALNGLLMPPAPPVPAVVDVEPNVAAALQTSVHFGQPAPTPSRSIKVEAAPDRQVP